MEKIKLDMAYRLLLMICIALTVACNSSDSGDGEECIGIDFSGITCIAEFLSMDGQRFGCDECTSDLRTQEFSIEFSSLLVSQEEAAQGIGTQFRVDGVGETFIPEFVSCSTINLFEIVQDQNGENIKGKMVGTLDSIEPILPGGLTLFINIPGVNVEDTSCGFCWAPVRPPCANGN